MLPPKPRKRPKTETREHYEQRLQEWQEHLLHDREIQPKGNSITQAYCTQKILPGLIAEVQRLRVTLGDYRGDMMLQEDNDPSHR